MLDSCVVMMNVTRITESYFNTVLNFKGKSLLVYFSLIVVVIIVSPKTLFFLSSLPPTTLFTLYCRCIFQSIVTVVVVVIVIVTNADAIVVVNISLCFATANETP